MIKGTEKLTPEEMEFALKVNENQKKAFGSESSDYDIIEVWKDDYNVICVRLREGNFYYYLNNGTWF